MSQNFAWTLLPRDNEKLDEGEAWTGYVTALREQNRNLRALEEELTNAGL
jgi:hypothetical protein